MTTTTTTATTKTREMQAQAAALAQDAAALKALRHSKRAASAVELLALSYHYAEHQPTLSQQYLYLHRIAITDEIIETVRPRLGADRSLDRNLGLLHSATILAAMQEMRAAQLQAYQ